MKKKVYFSSINIATSLFGYHLVIIISFGYHLLSSPLHFQPLCVLKFKVNLL